jgi:prevent-host-death family protein
MSKQYSITEARNHLASIVHDVEGGEPALLTRRGKAVAVLLSEAEYQRLRDRQVADLWHAIEVFRREHRLDAAAIADADFEKLRDSCLGSQIERNQPSEQQERDFGLYPLWRKRSWVR